MIRNVLTETYPVGSILAWQSMYNQTSAPCVSGQPFRNWDQVGGLCSRTSSVGEHNLITVPDHKLWDIDVDVSIQAWSNGNGGYSEGRFVIYLYSHGSVQDQVYSNYIDATKNQGVSVHFTGQFEISDIYGPYTVMIGWEGNPEHVFVGCEDYLGYTRLYYPEKASFTVRLVNQYERWWQ